MISRGVCRKLSDCVDYMVRSSRAFSESRLYDPYYSSPAVSSLSFMPSALMASREASPIRPTYTSASFRSG